MATDVLDPHVPVSASHESDIFHTLCKQWADLSPSTNAEPSITVHDLMQREAIQRARFAHEDASRRARHGRIEVRQDSMVGIMRAQEQRPDFVRAHEIAFEYNRRVATFTPHPPTQPIVKVSDATLVITDNKPPEVSTKAAPTPLVVQDVEATGNFDIPLDDKHLEQFQTFWEEKQNIRVTARPKARTLRHRAWQAALRFDPISGVRRTYNVIALACHALWG
jgi:hypothetical protein